METGHHLGVTEIREYIIKCNACGSSYTALFDIEPEIEEFDIKPYERCLKCDKDSEVTSELVNSHYIFEPKIRWSRTPDIDNLDKIGVIYLGGKND